MRIGELAAAAGVSVRVLRHYEAQGLIQSRRSANGYREYPNGVIETVRQVRLLLDCGFSTRQIYGVLPCFGEGANFDPVTCAGGARTVSCQAKRARSPDRSAEAKARPAVRTNRSF